LGRILFGIVAKAVGLRTTFIDVTDHNVKCRITFQILNTNIQLTRSSLVDEIDERYGILKLPPETHHSRQMPKLQTMHELKFLLE